LPPPADFAFLFRNFDRRICSENIAFRNITGFIGFWIVMHASP
jgi:hypothetical protein